MSDVLKTASPTAEALGAERDAVPDAAVLEDEARVVLGPGRAGGGGPGERGAPISLGRGNGEGPQAAASGGGRAEGGRGGGGRSRRRCRSSRSSSSIRPPRRRRPRRHGRSRRHVERLEGLHGFGFQFSSLAETDGKERWESEREFARGGGCVERASKDGKKRKNSSSRRRHSATRRNSLSEPKKRNFIPLRKRRTVEL